jgi:hypothetical protein
MIVQSSRARVLASGVLALVLAACGADARYVMIGTARAPTTSGVAEVDELDANSAQVAVHLEYMHPPSRLDPGLRSYVLWFVPPTGKAVYGGLLAFDPEARTGSATKTSPFHHFVVKITAEREDRPAAPSDFVVAAQEITID